MQTSVVFALFRSGRCERQKPSSRKRLHPHSLQGTRLENRACSHIDGKSVLLQFIFGFILGIVLNFLTASHSLKVAPRTRLVTPVQRPQCFAMFYLCAPLSLVAQKSGYAPKLLGRRMLSRKRDLHRFTSRKHSGLCNALAIRVE